MACDEYGTLVEWNVLPGGRRLRPDLLTTIWTLAEEMRASVNLIDHQRTGLHFRAGDANDLARQVQIFMSEERRHAAFRRAARDEYLAKYTAEANYQCLQHIYAAALEHSKSSRHSAAQIR